MHILKRQQLQIILSWIAVLLWMFLIFVLSAQPAPRSNGLSQKVTEVIIEKVGLLVPLDIKTSTTTDLIKRFNHIVRKCAHVSEYFVLGALVMNAMKTSKVLKFKALIFSVLICILYAISDELHQLFVPGRGAQVMDVLIDSAGAIAGIGCIFLIKRRNSTPYVE
ncbi:MAG TPA: VanZ family protein [Thermoanaerobacterales bacterium]|jgi:VanZ family protein|nr:VanZ family protein [Thermoanaerobacterales bacterium]